MKKYIVEKFLREDIGKIDNHFTVNGIDRMVAKGVPLHCAIHKINIENNIEEYSVSHKHDYEDELNIIVNEGAGDLVYRFNVDGETFELHAPACIWVPANISHSANAIRGQGVFVCLRFEKK